MTCQYLRDQKVEGEVRSVRVLRNPGGRYDGAHELLNKRILGISRRGKYMIFQLDRGVLVCHNAMSGYWDVKDRPWCFDYVEGKRTSKERDVRVEIDVLGPERLTTVRFHDSRLFGSLHHYYLTSSEVPCLSRLGPEAIVTPCSDLRPIPQWSVADFGRMRPEHEVKHALMDQHAVAGFGNIYACETLFEAKIDPFRKVKTLVTDEWERLVEHGQATLRNVFARKLDYSHLLCYRRKECCYGHGKIERRQLRGRSTYSCPECQH